MKKLAVILALFALLVSTSTAAQPLPPRPPVRVNVPNRLQQTPVWCWAAVSEQIITWSAGSSPSQCMLVSSVTSSLVPGMCCGTQHPVCVRTGTMPQIQRLIKTFGGRSSHVVKPSLNPLGIYIRLSNGRPIILEVRTTPAATHVVVVVGISFIRTAAGPVAMLEVNDPMSVYTQPIPYPVLYPNIVSVLVID